MRTSAGLILGTAAYMAPEQARSQTVDKRADIWAFGVVLWEMLTGRRPFAGETASDAIAAVLKEDPAWGQVSPRVRPLLRRCLEKDPRRRLHDIADARLWLEEPPAQEGAVPRSAPPSARSARLMLGAAVLCLAAVLGVVLWGGRSVVQDTSSIQFTINAPPGTTMDSLVTGAAVSPDERSIVFVASTSMADSALYLHSLESGTTRLLPGTDHADLPFWSPDSQSVAFIAAGRLKRIQIAGGAATDLGEAAANGAGAWGRGFIVLGLQGGGGVWRIPESGGAREQVVKVDSSRGEIFTGVPQLLPDGRRFLYYMTTADPQKRGVYVGSLDGKEERVLVLNTLNKALHVPARAGQPDALLYLREQTLVAQRFDPSSVRLSGEPSIVADPISRSGGVNYNAAFWAGPRGMLIYRTSGAEAQRRLVWMSREGKRMEEVSRPNRYSSFYLSPDAKRLAVDVMSGSGAHDIWIYDFARNMMTPQTSNPANDFLGVWSPDARRMVFGSSRTGASQLYLATPGGGRGHRRPDSQVSASVDPRRQVRPLQRDESGLEPGRIVGAGHRRRPEAFSGRPGLVLPVYRPDLARWTMDRLSVHALGHLRGVRAEISDPGRQDSALQCRRTLAEVARRRERGVLRLEERDSGRGSGRFFDRRSPSAAVAGPVSRGLSR
jgi:hypothetical protein